MTPKWLQWARELQAISQTGIHFSENQFDTERYKQIGDISTQIISRYTNLTVNEIQQINANELGYATPKVDVRGVIFRDSQVLLIKEILDNGRWTLPGGWADVNETPSEAALREVFEESGYEAKILKLLAVYDRDKQGHTPPLPHHVYKLFFLCEITGGKPTPNMEASEIAFFPVDDLPELSVSRVTESQIHRFYEHAQHPEWQTDFD